MSGKFLVLGKYGQVGHSLMAQLGARALGTRQGDVDLLDAHFIARLDKIVGKQPVSAVINAAAYTQVDKAEGEGRDDAWRLNAAAVAELAAWCKTRDIPLVHYSSDYVFDGSGSAPRREDAPTSPVNAYGESKREGERAIEETGGKYLIFRTSWVYDAYGKNFFNTILRLLHEKDSLNVVDDQAGAPTYAPHLAQATLEALERAMAMPQFPGGLYHLCGGGEVSWCGFAQAIFALARSRESGQSPKLKCQQVHPIPSSAYPLPARRPLNSRLDCRRAKEVLGVALPPWEAGLKECIEEKYAGSRLPHIRPEAHPAKPAGG